VAPDNRQEGEEEGEGGRSKAAPEGGPKESAERGGEAG